MGKTIVVCGYGPGISHSVATRFAEEGFQVALVARNADKVARAALALRDEGVHAKGFVCDLGDDVAVKALVADVRSSLGPITALHWNAYVGLAGDLTSSEAGELRGAFDVAVTGLVAAVQASLPDLKTQEGAAVLVTGGGFALYDAAVDSMIVQFGAMGLAVAKAAQHKLVGVLSKKLASDGIYVGEVQVLGMVKGTAFDFGNATVEADTIAERFWNIYQQRSDVCVQVA